MNVQESDRVRAGEPLMDGPSNPHDILSVLGEKALHAYLVNEIQEVYRLQGVNINDADDAQRVRRRHRIRLPASARPAALRIDAVDVGEALIGRDPVGGTGVRRGVEHEEGHEEPGDRRGPPSPARHRQQAGGGEAGRRGEAEGRDGEEAPGNLQGGERRHHGEQPVERMKCHEERHDRRPEQPRGQPQRRGGGAGAGLLAGKAPDTGGERHEREERQADVERHLAVGAVPLPAVGQRQQHVRPEPALEELARAEPLERDAGAAKPKWMARSMVVSGASAKRGSTKKPARASPTATTPPRRPDGPAMGRRRATSAGSARPRSRCRRRSRP